MSEEFRKDLLREEDIVATYNYYTLEQAEKIFRRKIKKKISRILYRGVMGATLFLLTFLVGALGGDILPCVVIGAFFAVIIFKEGIMDERDLKDM